MSLDRQGVSVGGVPLPPGMRDIEKLYNLARDKRPGARADLAMIVAALLARGVTDREGEMVADILIELLRQAEKDFRMALSSQLAIADNVPLRLVLQLANDEIDIARPVLKKSKALGEMDLVYIIKSKTGAYWSVIAARHDLGNRVIDTLADTRDLDTAIALAENTGIKLTEHALAVLSDIAQGEESLAVPLLRRDDVPHDIAAMLYMYVGEQLKTFILENYDVDEKQVERAVRRVADEFAVEINAEADPLPEEDMVLDAQKYKAKQMLDVNLMLGTLRRGHIRSFIAQFAVYTGLAPEVVAQMLRQTHGQGLAVACKAFGIEKSDFVSLFMLTNRIRSMGAMVGLDEMTKAISYFERISPDVAKRIMAGDGFS